jgi:hypothetical protein
MNITRLRGERGRSLLGATAGEPGLRVGELAA